MKDLVLRYKDKSIWELLKIKAKWACGRHSNKALSYFESQMEEGYRIYLVNPQVLIKCANLQEVNPELLFTGNTTNDYRIARILFRWENNEFVDPPTIHLSNDNRKTLSFSDGRHRAKLSYLLKHKFLPVAIPSDEINTIGSIVKLWPLKN